ncbi:L-threonine kinase PduX [Clostridium aceticum]|uniref:L-threonine kinase PduX n=1 Tax=Clostridium aceticum TaxID=84022 RepID=A0A0D8ID95_9CLOT|nr:hypothetical protein [Clostridium aceticum]AKL93574.1 L-threonine kinase PduX [Clostridium aceticum]KJF27166.1 hypothetical protein TZ02_08820 [Clostridium aceticum]
MTIEAICPASCGELLQGYIEGGEKLISYSINLFSKVIIEEEQKKSKEKAWKNYSKAYKMLEQVFQYYGYHQREAEHLYLQIESAIPIAKGMASSTADLAATAVATANYLGKNISEEEVAKLCIKIEPTDSTVFSSITLFDHLKGSFTKQYGNIPKCKVLLLEGKEKIDTIDFRKTDRSSYLRENEKEMKKALQCFEEGIKNNSLKQIGKAATISAFANQSILYKEGLEEINALSEKLGAYGINVAHSGSVIGILYNEGSFDQEKFCWSIKKKSYMKNYLSIVSYNMIPGGGKIVNT